MSAKKGKFKILVAELASPEALEILKANCDIVDVKYGMSREEQLKLIPEYHAILVRSETLIDEEFLDKATNLKIVGRAGSGLDNINIPYATKKGVIVANTPESNIVSAAEHTIALLLATSRNVAWADRFIKTGDWDRKRFKGSEFYGKTLGIIGLGRIGSLVAQRVRGFNMKVIAYDPYIADSRFEQFKTEKRENLEDLIKESDFITIHTPRTKETIDIISDKEIAMMKDDVRLVNVARGGLINEEALVKGLESGKVASAGIDVWINEPQESHDLYKFDTFIGTPHLGASTHEAQARVGTEVANEIVAGLKGEIVKNALNIPSVSDEKFAKLGNFIKLAEKIGRFYAQIRDKEPLKKVELTFKGKEVDEKEDVKVLSLMTLKEILNSSVPETVNLVNATSIAEQRGIDVEEKVDMSTGNYTNLITVKITEGDDEIFEIAGTVFDRKHPRIVKINEYDCDLEPEGKMIYIPHKNVPGVVGKVGTKMGDFNVNISNMMVSKGKNDSLMMITIDNNIPESLLEELETLEEINKARLLTF